jgi:hypothetical protein
VSGSEPELCSPPGHTVDDLRAFERMLAGSFGDRLDAAWIWGILTALAGPDAWERALRSLAERKQADMWLPPSLRVLLGEAADLAEGAG